MRTTLQQSIAGKEMPSAQGSAGHNVDGARAGLR
jgi:hypothetical protein